MNYFFIFFYFHTIDISSFKGGEGFDLDIELYSKYNKDIGREGFVHLGNTHEALLLS